METVERSTSVNDQFLKDRIRSIPDFPVPGIDFKDIVPLLADRDAFGLVIDDTTARWRELGIDAVVAVESRGFVLGAPLAHQLNAGLVLVRKPGKLPGTTDRFAYSCEYCDGELEVSQGLVGAGTRCLIVDDLLATGGTARATAEYLRRVRAHVVGFTFIVELSFLNGRALLTEAPVHSVLAY